jgi:hypothetical protein
MEYQLALSPDLNVRPSDFVKMWNESQEYRAVAEARLDTPGAGEYNPWIDGAIAVLTTLGGGIATNALYDWIKQALVKKGVRKKTRFMQIDKPDGTRIIVVTIDEQ